MSLVNEFTKGLWKENPTFVLVLGMCPTLAITTSFENALGMGAATTFVLVCSNLVISSIRKIVPDNVRIPVYVVVIAAFVSIVEMIMAAYLPDLNEALGIFIPLIVVNCIILGRAEAFASKNGLVASLLDGIGMGLGFTLAIGIIASIREILGNGTWYGIKLFGEAFKPAMVMIMPPGGFLTLGLVIGLIAWLRQRRQA